jgi:hypothetical protein
MNIPIFFKIYFKIFNEIIGNRQFGFSLLHLRHDCRMHFLHFLGPDRYPQREAASPIKS